MGLGAGRSCGAVVCCFLFPSAGLISQHGSIWIGPRKHVILAKGFPVARGQIFPQRDLQPVNSPVGFSISHTGASMQARGNLCWIRLPMTWGHHSLSTSQVNVRMKGGNHLPHHELLGGVAARKREHHQTDTTSMSMFWVYPTSIAF